MTRTTQRNFTLVAALTGSALIAFHAPAAVVNTAFTFADMTNNPVSAVWSDGGGNDIDMSRLNTGNSTPSSIESALTTVTNFTPGLDFSVTGSFSITTHDLGNSSTTTNRMSLFAVTLFGDTSNNETGVFASLIISEGRANYDGGQRLGVGTNAPIASVSYVGNFAGNGTAEAGETFLTGSNVSLPLDATPTYEFDIQVTYVNATTVNIAFELSDGTDTNTLTINNADITGLQTNNVFGVITSQRNRSLAGTFSDLTVNQIPEPASLALMGLGGLLMLGRGRRA